jgi:hypothetical protein
MEPIDAGPNFHSGAPRLLGMEAQARPAPASSSPAARPHDSKQGLSPFELRVFEVLCWFADAEGNNTRESAFVIIRRWVNLDNVAHREAVGTLRQLGLVRLLPKGYHICVEDRDKYYPEITTTPVPRFAPLTILLLEFLRDRTRTRSSEDSGLAIRALCKRELKLGPKDLSEPLSVLTQEGLARDFGPSGYWVDKTRKVGESDE